jgi:hypothetical protein
MVTMVTGCTPAPRAAVVLYVRGHVVHGANRREGIQLACDHADGLDDLRDAAGGDLRRGTGMRDNVSNLKTALVLAAVAAVFFFGIMLKYW